MSHHSTVLTLTTEKAKEPQGVCMRRKLLMNWLLMAFAVFALFLAILYAAGVFTHPARRLGQELSMSLEDTAEAVTAHFDVLEAKSLQLSRKTTEELGKVLTLGDTIESLSDSPEELSSLEKAMLPQLESVLRSGGCSGVFLVLDATVNTGAPEASHSRSGLYLRRQGLYAANPVNQSITCYRGCQSAARSYGIELHNRWNPEFDIDRIPGYSDLMGQKVSSLTNSLFWTKSQKMQGTWVNALFLYVPVTLFDGTVCGLCGVEVSELFFRLSFPAQSGAFGSRIAVLGYQDNGRLSLSGGLIGGQEESHLDTKKELGIEKGGLYDTLTDGDETFVGLEKSLPFQTLDGSTMSLAILLPREGYYRVMMESLVSLSLVSLAFFLCVLFLAFFFTGRFVRPIEQRLEKALTKKETCGILEIDALLDAMRKEEGQERGLPPKIESFLTGFCERVQTLTPMERTVLQYYIDGYGIEEISKKAFISINTVKKHNTNINRKLNVSTREELKLYIEIFRRCGKLDEITSCTKPG